MAVKSKIREHYVSIVIFALLGIYYGYRMLCMVPWYDELYTYLHFTTEGPWYSATHWPFPNNHIFFSIVSSLIAWCGNIVGLRGISYFAAMGTVFLLYRLFKELFSEGVSLMTVVSYSLLLLSNKLAVQGRGYSLATFFLMLSIYCGYRIAFGESGKRHYVLWGISLWLGLYTVVSSIYWVAAVCLCCGLALLLCRRYGKLLCLIGSSLLAAGMTLLSYAVVWLSIGAQQISGDVTSGYLGEDIWFLVRTFPRTCLRRGITFMTSDRSVQGLDRKVFLQDFKYFARGIVSAFFGKTSMWFYYGLLLVVGVSLLLLVLCIFRKKRAYLYPLLLTGVGFPGIFAALWIQSAYPFTRVFSFLGIFLIMPVGLLYGVLSEKIGLFVKEKYQKPLFVMICLGAAVCASLLWFSPLYMEDYDATDSYAYDAVSQIEWDKVDSYLVSDVYAEQQIQFGEIYGKHRTLQEEKETPDVIVTQKTILTGAWPELISQEELQKCRIEEREILYENERYVVYGRLKGQE